MFISGEYVKEGGKAPKWYGAAYPADSYDCMVYYIMPFNLIARLFRYVGKKIKGYNFNEEELKLAKKHKDFRDMAVYIGKDAYNEGYREGHRACNEKWKEAEAAWKVVKDRVDKYGKCIDYFDNEIISMIKRGNKRRDNKCTNTKRQ